MSGWKAGKVQWFSDDFEEGMIIDTEDGEFYYLIHTVVPTIDRT